MLEFKIISFNDLKQMKRRVRGKSKLLEEYENYIKELPKGKVGRLTIGDNKPVTIKNRLKRARESLNMDDLVIKRIGDHIVFWKEEEKTGNE
jgi:hypothetical protein